MPIWRQPPQPTQARPKVIEFEAKTGSDIGAGADVKVAYPAVSHSRGEAGIGADAFSGNRSSAAADVGSGLDAILSLLGKMVTDAGVCSLENSYLQILTNVRESHETGGGVDASALSVLFAQVDTGAGLEAVIARALYAQEYPAGASDLAKLIMATLAGHETGSGADASLMSYYQKVTETGSGSELAALSYLFSSHDTGIGAEAVTLLAAMIAHDTGMGVERVIARLLKLAESGMGVEVAQLVGLAGRAMKARMYTRPYFKTRLYMKPVYKTRLYTDEVQQ